MNTSWAGKTALVTGAARRLGKAIALELATRGVDVVIHYRTSEPEARATVEEIRACGVRAECVCADLSDARATARLGPAVNELLGPTHILINNASIFEPISFRDTTAEQLARNESIHVHSPLILARWLSEQLPEGEDGSVVNLLDHRAFRPDPAYVPYSLSKAGLAALTTLLARELAPRVRVNSVSPGAILAPPETAKADQANHLERVSADTPLGRAGAASDVVAATLFLALEAGYTTGVDLPVDGGKHLGC